MTKSVEPSPLDETGVASVAAHFVRLVTDYGSRQGLSAATLLAASGLVDFALDDNEARLPFNDFIRLCDQASKLLHDPCLGLHAGVGVRPGHLGSHGFALMSCATVREMMERSLRYSSLVIDACRNTFEVNETLCIRYWRSNLPQARPVGRTQDELNMALWVSLARWVSNQPELNPAWVSFQHEEPAELDEYQSLFSCPLRFGAPDTAIAFSSTLLDLPLPLANPPVRQMLDVHCEHLLLDLASKSEPPWLTRCRQVILRSFELGVPESAGIAASLGMSEEGLRQALTERKLSFRALVDELRRKLALGYIQNRDLSLVDIAYLLGFSEQSAFQRAFKRWTAQTPGEYRRLVA